MNFLKRGPEIKLSDVKVPAFIEDIYLDLKERHLLPVAAILLVAIVVVPFAVAQSSSSPEPGGAEGEASVSSEAESSSGNLVAQATPGLRKYQRRLDHLRAKDPFKQQSTGEGQGSSEGGSGGESVGGTGSGSSTESSTGSYGGGGESGGSTEYESETETRTTHSKLTYYSYAIDVRVTTGAAKNQGESEGEEEGGARQSAAGNIRSATNGAQSSAKAGRHTSVRRKLPELTMLPSRKTPAVIYMGSTKDAKKALLVVSSDVSSIFGDAKCVLGSQTCEMIALEPGLPETFVYGGNGRTFKLELLKIRLVETSKLNRAPLGKPKKKGSKSKQGGKGAG
jgi:hypothetical protein